MKIHWLQHVPFEGLGSIESWAKGRRHVLASTRLWAGDRLPSADEIEFLIVMGGPMGVQDEAEYEWITPEKSLVRSVIEAGGRVLGVCLGAQLIASALGAPVAKNAHREIGWFPVTLTPQASESFIFKGVPAEFSAFHWHGDTFEIPTDATHTARSAACANQAFTFDDRVVALQFHLETLTENAEALLKNCSDELVDGKWIQTADQVRTGLSNSVQATRILDGILDKLVAASASTPRE